MSNVYISVGSKGNPKQEEFVRSVESYIAAQGLAPITVGRNYFKNAQPLKTVLECMRNACGVVVVAFERTYTPSGVERRGSTAEEPFSERKLPTIWNQIEAALAYSMGRPLLVLAEKGLHAEGLLETSFDWYVQSVDLDPRCLSEPQFLEVFRDWKERCTTTFDSAPPAPAVVDPIKLTVGQLLSSLTTPQLWALLVATVSALAAIAGVAYKFGTIAH